jgi:hypothetical protein
VHHLHAAPPATHPATAPPARHPPPLPRRTEHNTRKQRYRARAGIEGTISQAVALTGIRKARYAGIGKVHLEHIFAAIAVNLARVDAWWKGTPLQRTRTTHLARLDLALAA